MIADYGVVCSAAAVSQEHCSVTCAQRGWDSCHQGASLSSQSCHAPAQLRLYCLLNDSVM
eukprot:6214532-Pleurochrysis_carterae.AAC.3